MRKIKIDKINVPKADFAILCAIILLVMVGTLVWLVGYAYPPHWDMSVHLTNSLIYTDIFNGIFSGGIKDFFLNIYRFFIGYGNYYPPLTYWATVPWILIFGRTIEAAILSNFLFLIIMVFSSYSIARRVWGRLEGILAALVLVSYPFVTAQFHEFQLDLPLVAVTIFSIWGLYYSEGFKTKKSSFVFGLTIGLAMLAKWTVLAFLLGPVLFVLINRLFEIIKIKEVKERKQKIQEFLVNIVYTALGAFLVAGLWYLRHIKSLKAGYANNALVGLAEGDPLVGTTLSLRYYYDTLLNHQIRLLMLIPFLIGIVMAFFKKGQLKKIGPFLTMILVSYYMMTRYQNKDFRYIEPIIIGFTFISIYWVTLLPKWIKFVSISYLIVVCLFQFITINYGVKIFPNMALEKNIRIPDLISGEATINVYRLSGYFIGANRQENWHQMDILSIINDDYTKTLKQNEKRVAQVAVYYVDAPWFNKENLDYYRLQQRMPIHINPYPEVNTCCSKLDYVISTEESSVFDIINSNDQLQEMYSEKLPNGIGVKVWKVKK